MTGPGVIVLAMRHVITLELDLSALRRAIGGGSYVRGAAAALGALAMAGSDGPLVALDTERRKGVH